MSTPTYAMMRRGGTVYGQRPRAALATVMARTPRIFSCAKCGWPVLVGCCCGRCRDDNPSEASS